MDSSQWVTLALTVEGLLLVAACGLGWFLEGRLRQERKKVARLNVRQGELRGWLDYRWERYAEAHEDAMELEAELEAARGGCRRLREALVRAEALERSRRFGALAQDAAMEALQAEVATLTQQRDAAEASLDMAQQDLEELRAMKEDADRRVTDAVRALEAATGERDGVRKSYTQLCQAQDAVWFRLGHAIRELENLKKRHPRLKYVLRGITHALEVK